MSSDKACRVYVGNLDWSVDEDTLQNHMQSAGNIVKTQIFKYKDGLSKGWGIVTYETPDEALTAISSLTNTPIFERLIFVREDRENEQQEESRGTRFRNNYAKRNNRNNRPYNNDVDMSTTRYRRNNIRNRNPRSTPPPPREGEVVLNVSNLDVSTHWKDLKNFFNEAGDVKRADVIPSMRGEKSGTVYFSNMDDAVHAMETLNDKELKGSKIKIFLKE